MWAKPTALTLTLGLSCLASTSVLAQDNAESNDRLERIEQKLDRLVGSADKQDQTFIEQPLGDRRYGVEFNFFRLLTLGQSQESLSGTFSLFNTDNNTEIAFPFMYSRGEHDEIYHYYSSPYGYISGYDKPNKDLTSFTVDAHYRKYLGHRLDGFYISGFGRMAHLNGLKDEDSQFSEGSETKFGVGVGIGYRIISDDGFYWGASLSMGRYLVGDSEVFHDSENLSADIDDSEIIFDVELLKFGYAF